MIFTPEDALLLYEALPCPSRSSDAQSHPSSTSSGTIAGVRVEESTGTSDPRLAEEFKAKREAEIYRGQLYGGRISRTFAEAVVSYLEARDGAPPASSARCSITSTRRRCTRSTSTRSRRARRRCIPAPRQRPATASFYTPAVAVLKHAAARGWCDALIVKRPKPAEGVVRWLTPAEADRLIDACSPHLRPLVIFLLYTGARAGEALWLDWRDVDLDRAHVSFEKTKTKYPRGVPLHPRVVAALANLKSIAKARCFSRPTTGSRTNRFKGDDDTSAGTRIGTAFKSACRRAGPRTSGFTIAATHGRPGTIQTQSGSDGADAPGRVAHGEHGSPLRCTRMSREFASGSIERLPGGNLGEATTTEGKSA